jgi:hypothetical protein
MDHEHARCLKRPRSWLSIGLLRIGRAIVRPYRSSDSITRYCSWRRKHGGGAPCQSTLLLPCRREDYPGWQTTVGTAMRRPYRCGNEAARLTGLHLNFRRLLLCFRALGQGHREYPIFKAGRDLVGVDTLRAEAAFAPVVAWAIARATLTRSFAAGGHKRVRSSQNSNGLDSLIVRSGGSSDLNASTSQFGPLPLGSSRQRMVGQHTSVWRDQGRVQQARELLAPVYGWFTEASIRSI